ncbi:hypothetical protein E3Q23_03690, partial [Wallemia mellicola]
VKNAHINQLSVSIGRNSDDHIDVNSVPIPQLLGGSLDLNAGNLEAPVNDGLVDNLLGNLTY